MTDKYLYYFLRLDFERMRGSWRRYIPNLRPYRLSMVMVKLGMITALVCTHEKHTHLGGLRHAPLKIRPFKSESEH